MDSGGFFCAVEVNDLLPSVMHGFPARSTTIHVQISSSVLNYAPEACMLSSGDTEGARGEEAVATVP